MGFSQLREHETLAPNKRLESTRRVGITFPGASFCRTYLEGDQAPGRYKQHLEGYVSGKLLEHPLASEANRCFYLALGSALSLHPFILNNVFRWMSPHRTATVRAEVERDVQQFAGLVDPTCLQYLWFTEMRTHVIWIIATNEAICATVMRFSEYDINSAASRSATHITLRHEGDISQGWGFPVGIC